MMPGRLRAIATLLLAVGAAALLAHQCSRPKCMKRLATEDANDANDDGDDEATLFSKRRRRWPLH